MKTLWIKIDGDDIGKSIDLALYTNDIEIAKAHADNVHKCIHEISTELEHSENYDLLMKGCDDVLFKTKNEMDIEPLINKLRSKFYKKTTFTLSVGIGNNLQECLFNLHLAKQSGKNKTIRS